MMDAFDCGDRAAVAELTDYLAYMAMSSDAMLNVYRSVLLKEKGKQLATKMMIAIAKEWDTEKERVMEGYEFEKVDEDA